MHQVMNPAAEADTDPTTSSHGAEPAALSRSGDDHSQRSDPYLERLCQACFAGDVVAVTEAAASIANINERLPERVGGRGHLAGGGSALHYACSSGSTACVAWLVEYAGADLLNDTRNGRSPLYVACADGCRDVAQYLLDRNVDVDRGAKDGASPLHIASQRGFLPIVMLLLAYGANVNLVPAKRWHSALPVALYQRHYSVAKALLDHGSTFEHVGLQDCLRIACEEGRTDIILLLLENGADPASTQYHNDFTPLHAAVGYGRLEAVRILVVEHSLPADRLNAATHKERETPLSIAVRAGQESITHLLLSHGAAPSLRQGVYLTDAEQGRAHVSLTTQGYIMPMQLAAQCGSVAVASLLAVYGARDASTDERQLVEELDVPAGSAMWMWWRRTMHWNQLQFAVHSQYTDEVRRLLRRGADPHKKARPTPSLVTLARMQLLHEGGGQQRHMGDRDSSSTASLIRSAMQGWRPATHSLFGPAFGRGVWLLLLIQQRINATATTASAWWLPYELWEKILQRCGRAVFVDLDRESNTEEERATRRLPPEAAVSLAVAELDLFD